jgi:flagellum-specific peptidoglycan hydrolase FlgJ
MGEVVSAHSVRKPWWQQATALVTVTTGGVITGFSFVPGAAATMTLPTSMPLHLLALQKAASDPADSSDAGLRSAIVNVANYYLRLARTNTPAQMEAMIWGKDSLDGADHGPSCAAFASLTLELAAQAVGKQSWVTGGTTYPWPLHEWADVRVDPNTDSLAIMSIAQDAQAHNRWHPLGDGYQPQPGDWVLFSGHVEVVTSYSDGVLDTIGADSLPNLTVNAHAFPDPLADQGVAGFVDNGHLDGAQAPNAAQPAAAQPAGAPPVAAQATGTPSAGTQPAAAQPTPTRPATAQPAAGRPAAGRPAQAPGGETTGPRRGPVGAGEGAPQGLANIPGVVAIGPSAAPAASHAGGATSGGAANRGAANGGAVKGGAVKGGVTKGGVAKGGVAKGGVTKGSAAKGGSKGTAAIPGVVAPPAALAPSAPSAPLTRSAPPTPSAPSAAPASPASAVPSAVAGASASGAEGSAASGPYRKSETQDQAQQTRAQQAFISDIAPGAIAAQQRYGVPASVTIAQAIDESSWGRSTLAARDHNLFGIKGTGPAGSVDLPTQEYVDGQWVTVTAPFRVYHNIAESITDHTQLLATSGYYQRAMDDRAVPDAFANDLTGIYATDPNYGSNLIALMRLYNLYRFDTPAAQPSAPAAGHVPAAHPGTPAAHPGTPAAHPGTPAAAGAPTAEGSAGIAGGAAIPGAAPFTGHAASAPGSAAVPGVGAVPGGATVSGAGMVPGVAAVSGVAAVPGVPNVPGVGAVPGVASAPGLATAPGFAAVPGVVAYPGGAPVPANGGGHGLTAAPGQPTHPGTVQPGTVQPGTVRPGTVHPGTVPSAAAGARRGSARIPGLVAPTAQRYQAELPAAVATAFFTTAKTPLARSAPLYRDVASQVGIRWELLAACDWMQCQAHPRYSPVHGEKIGMPNPDGTVYPTKSEALAQCASDLIRLTAAVYGIDLTAPRILSVRALADAFAAFRWGALLRRHRISAMEFPYSVAGLTPQHMKMHWPAINEPGAPDKPGGRFRMPFGAVPVVLSLNYPATV